jgi:hypothetical protein
MKRRTLLVSTATVSTALIAGCSGQSDEEATAEPSETATDTATDTPTETATESSVGDLSTPQGLEAETTQSSIALNWEPVENAEEYKIYMGGEMEKTVGSPPANFFGLDSGTAYELAVAAVAGSTESSKASLEVNTKQEDAYDVVIPQTDKAPTIDGTIGESEWGGVTIAVDNVLSGIGAPKNESDLSGIAEVMYDDRAIYVLADIKDDVIAPDATGSTYKNDNVEVYVDPQTSNSQEYGEYSGQYRFMPDGSYGGGKEGSEEAVEFAVSETDDGYVMEIAVLWEQIGTTPEAGQNIGFEVHYTDNDEENDRSAKLAWANESDSAYGSRLSWGTARLEMPYQIAKASSAPSIDGQRDDAYADANSIEVDNVLGGIGAPADETDLSGTLSAVWDADALYVFGDVTDDMISGPLDSNYKNDNVEIYVDPVAGNDEYVGKAAQYRFLPYNGEFGGGKSNIEEAVEFAFAETDDGYNFEAAFSWAELDVDPAAGELIGFEVHYTDNDDESDRSAKLAWENTSDNAYGDRGSWGNAVLTD